MTPYVYATYPLVLIPPQQGIANQLHATVTTPFGGIIKTY